MSAFRILLSALLTSASLLAVEDAQALRCGPSPVNFTNHLISADYTYAYGIAVGDVDNDGDPDITSADTDSDSLYWYANDGAGSFQRHVVEDTSGWYERHQLADMNGDGFLDIVVNKITDDSIVWFANDGTPEDGGWTQYAIAAGTLDYAYDVAVADLDADGDLDVAASSYAGNEFAWFENPGMSTIENWTKHDVARGEITLTMRVADFNSDGRPDLLASALGDGLFWFENSGAPATIGWIQHRLMFRGRPSHGEPVDMDGDGDLDVVMARGGAAWPRGGVTWFENRGKPRFRQHRIHGRLPQAFEAVAGDIDGDGDIDVAATRWNYPGGLMWFENRGNARRWCKRVILDVWQMGNSVLLHDLDGDGRLDVISTAERATNELRWFRNDGP